MGKKGDGTRKLIREKAAGLFAQRGFKNVTMNDICQATGLSRGGLYRHYDSTKLIFSEIVDELMQAQDNELSEKMKAEFPATQILDEILERYRQEMVDGEASLSVAIYEYYSGSSATDDHRENLLSKQYEYSVEMWRAFISYGIKRGEFKETDARELIDILLFAYQGVRMYSTIMPLDEQIPVRIIHHVKKILTM